MVPREAMVAAREDPSGRRSRSCARAACTTPGYSQPRRHARRRREDHHLRDRRALPAGFQDRARRVLRQRGPASTMVEVRSLSHPDYMIEVEAIAVI